MVRGVGQQRQGDAEQAVEAEFLQDAGVQHGGGRGRGGVGEGAQVWNGKSEMRMPKPMSRTR